jgi:hypothetical protein
MDQQTKDEIWLLTLGTLICEVPIAIVVVVEILAHA